MLFSSGWRNWPLLAVGFFLSPNETVIVVIAKQKLIMPYSRVSMSERLSPKMRPPKNINVGRESPESINVIRTAFISSLVASIKRLLIMRIKTEAIPNNIPGKMYLSRLIPTNSKPVAIRIAVKLAAIIKVRVNFCLNGFSILTMGNESEKKTGMIIIQPVQKAIKEPIAVKASPKNIV